MRQTIPRYRKSTFSEKSGLGIVILMLLMTIALVASSAWLFKKEAQKSSELNQIEEELTITTQAKVQLETQLEELNIQNTQLTKQVEELSQEVQNLKSEGVAVNDQVSVEDKKYAYLTFDDGPSANTIKILDFLKANDIKATFFVLGKSDQKEVYKRIVAEGHTLAVHSNTHEYSNIYRNVDSFMKDINALTVFLEETTGVNANILRFPGGSNNQISFRYGGKEIMDKIIPEVEKAGYVYFDWNVDSQDAAKSHQDKQVIVNSVLSGAKYTDHAVILMHDAAAKTTTVEALPEIVTGLKKQGYIFRALTADTEPVKFK